MSNDCQNRVFTNVKNYILQEYPDCEIQNNTTQNPTRLPAVMVSMIDSPEIGMDIDYGDDTEDNPYQAEFEIQSNSNVNITESRDILLLACKAMKKMGFRRTYGPSHIASSYQRTYGSSIVASQTDQNIFRMVARFERAVGSLNEIPKFIFESEG